MIVITDPYVQTRGESRPEARTLDAGWLEKAIDRGSINWSAGFNLMTGTVTMNVTQRDASGIGAVAYDDVVKPGAEWSGIDLTWVHADSAFPTTRATTPTATTVSSVCRLLRMRRMDERILRLPPERQALYQRIVKRRDKTGKLAFGITDALRELRENG